MGGRKKGAGSRGRWCDSDAWETAAPKVPGHTYMPAANRPGRGGLHQGFIPMANSRCYSTICNTQQYCGHDLYEKRVRQYGVIFTPSHEARTG